MTPPHNLPERIRILRVPVPTHRSVLGDGVHEASLARHRDVSVLVDPAAPVAVAYGDAVVDGGDSFNYAGYTDASGGLEAGEGGYGCK